MEKAWSFRYLGPVAAEDDRACPLCTAVATGICAAHPTPANGCPACHIAARVQAGREGYCANHCGLRTAIRLHTDEHVRSKIATLMPEGGQDSFNKFAETIQLMAEHFKHVRVHVVCVEPFEKLEYQELVLEGCGILPSHEQG
jgi:hypothetical protein